MNNTTSPGAIPSDPPRIISNNKEACMVWRVLHHVWAFSTSSDPQQKCSNLVKVIGPMLLGLRLLFEFVKTELSSCDLGRRAEMQLLLLDIGGRNEWVGSKTEVSKV